ncbi:MAG: UDP-2,4-diacetamido-2,4,6-trideoxy-beta-L-altropyranose hydrolase [Alphaproteobacteria bacterium]|nr:UDP-2,4-diacetamido-2,4,6-trideoxy-beta-L-altropyranose hydrolase [Alphaproteobacteria bacterium]
MQGSARGPVAVVVQARFASTRLPGKVLLRLAGASVLEHVLRRCMAIPGVDHVICATTDGADTDPVAAEARRVGAMVFRGSESDVLGRYLGAAEMVGAGLVMRVTSDCPLIDPAICGEVLRLMEERRADLACNNMPRSWPHGLDVECFTIEALRAADRATLPGPDREHVTPWIRRATSLRQVSLAGPGWPYAAHRWTLDHPDDFRFFEALFARLPPLPAMPDLQEVLNVLAAHPEIAATNRHLAGSPERAAGPLALIRFDAGEAIGGGHAMRCATFQAALEGCGWRTRRAVSRATAQHFGLVGDGGDIVLPDEGTPEEEARVMRAGATGAELLVVDHYGRDRTLEAAARPPGGKVLVIDDLADRPHDADILMDATPGRQAADYRPLLPEGAQVLPGPAHALVRECFRAARPEALRRRAQAAPPRRILVSCGLIDAANATELALRGIAGTGLDFEIDVILGPRAPHRGAVAQAIAETGLRARLAIDAARMAELMAAADLCIGAGGTSTWERCCVGLPSLVIGVAENQRPTAEALRESGAARILGWIGEVAPAGIAATLRELADDPQALAAMAEAAARLVDGRGAERLLLALLAPRPSAQGAMIRLRPVAAGDEARLLDWQKAPATRRFARDPRIPTAGSHAAWFAARLNDPSCLLTIIEADGEPAGFLRLDRRGNAFGRPMHEISIAIAPDHYRRGIARAALALAARLMRGCELVAFVLEANDASHRLFREAGYSTEADGYYHLKP